MARKFNRVLINDKWLHYFADSIVKFISPRASDHCPTLVHVLQPSFSPHKPFKVFNIWTKHPDFLSTVEGSWYEPIMGSPMVILQNKLKRLKSCLKIFSKLHYDDFL